MRIETDWNYEREKNKDTVKTVLEQYNFALFTSDGIKIQQIHEHNLRTLLYQIKIIGFIKHR